MSAVAVIAVIALGLIGPPIQKPGTGDRPPSAKGEAVVVQGCVSGSLLRELRAQKSDMPTELQTAVVYRLTGEKKLLQLIRKEHENQLLEVSGEVTSNSTGVARSKRMGKLRVFAGDGRPEQTQKGQAEPYPTLRVTAFEVIRPSCER